MGCLNWIALRTRPDTAWETSRAASLITHDPDNCFIRVKHICQYLHHTLSHALRYVPLFQSLHSPSRSYGYWEMPPLRQQGRRVSKELLSIMVSLPNKGKVVTLFNGDLAGSEAAWRTRHISVKALWLHKMSRRGIKFTYQPTSEMAADSLTKGLGASRLPQIKEDLRLIED